MENKYLLWIKMARPFISISRLEQFIGVPALCLDRYLRSGVFPEKHLPLLKEKLEPLCRLEPAWVFAYVRQLLGEREAVLAEHETDQRRLIANTRQEQIIDDLVRLYLVIRNEDPTVAFWVKWTVMERVPAMKNLFNHVEENGRPVNLEEIRGLVIDPEATGAPPKSADQ